jgi:hypothetical protein
MINNVVDYNGMHNNIKISKGSYAHLVQYYLCFA